MRRVLGGHRCGRSGGVVVVEVGGFDVGGEQRVACPDRSLSSVREGWRGSAAFVSTPSRRLLESGSSSPSKHSPKSSAASGIGRNAELSGCRRSRPKRPRRVRSAGSPPTPFQPWPRACWRRSASALDACNIERSPLIRAQTPCADSADRRSFAAEVNGLAPGDERVPARSRRAPRFRLGLVCVTCSRRGVTQSGWEGLRPSSPCQSRS